MSSTGTVQEEGLVKAISESWAAVIQEIVALREDLAGGDLTAGLTGKTSEHIKISRLTANELRDFEGLLAKVFSLDAEATVHELAALRAALQMARVSGSTYYTIQHLMSLLHFSGLISGGAVTDAGGETIDVAAGTGTIRATDSDVAELLFFNWAASAGIAVPTDTTRYVGIEYNSGSPQVVLKTSETWDFNTDFPLAIIVNTSSVLVISSTRVLAARGPQRTMEYTLLAAGAEIAF